MPARATTAGPIDGPRLAARLTARGRHEGVMPSKSAGRRERDIGDPMATKGRRPDATMASKNVGRPEQDTDGPKQNKGRDPRGRPGDTTAIKTVGHLEQDTDDPKQNKGRDPRGRPGATTAIKTDGPLEQGTDGPKASQRLLLAATTAIKTVGRPALTGPITTKGRPRGVTTATRIVGRPALTGPITTKGRPRVAMTAIKTDGRPALTGPITTKGRPRGVIPSRRECHNLVPGRRIPPRIDPDGKSWGSNHPHADLDRAITRDRRAANARSRSSASRLEALPRPNPSDRLPWMGPRLKAARNNPTTGPIGR